MTKELESYAIIGQHKRHWYAMQAEQIREWCARHDVSVEYFTGVFACLSPRVSVLQNWKMAIRYCRDDDLKGVMYSSRQAVEHFVATGEIRGPKTKAFFNALMGDPDALVLDVWMARALRLEHKHVTQARHVPRITRRMKQLAASFQWSVAETQAAVWAGIRSSWNYRPDNANQLELIA